MEASLRAHFMVELDSNNEFGIVRKCGFQMFQCFVSFAELRRCFFPKRKGRLIEASFLHGHLGLEIILKCVCLEEWLHLALGMFTQFDIPTLV